MLNEEKEMIIEDARKELVKLVNLRIDKTKGKIEFDSVIVGTKQLHTLLTAYEKEKEKNNELLSDNIESFQKYFAEELHTIFIDKDKLRKIIYPAPENPIPIEVQQSEMYKRLLKEVEETNNE